MRSIMGGYKYSNIHYFRKNKKADNTYRNIVIVP